MWMSYKELSIIGPENLDLIIPSLLLKSLVPPPGHLDVEDRYLTFQRLVKTLDVHSQIIKIWVENMLSIA